MGEYARNREEPYLAGRDEVDSLVDEIGEYVHLITAKQGRQIKLYEKYGDRAVATEHHIRQRESRQYLHRSAAGKAILAELPINKVDQIVDEHGIKEATGITIAERDALLNELNSIRERVRDERSRVDVGSSLGGAAIVGPDNRVRGAISISAPLERCKEEEFHQTFPRKM